MKNIIMAFLATWFTIASTFVVAQSGIKISGQILNAEGKPPDAATITLLAVPDSVVIKSALTDAAGSYMIEDVKKGDYKLRVTMTGYDVYKSDTIHVDDKPVILPLINLKQKGAVLKGVTVTAQKPFLERKIDRTVINVDALISNAGTTALDVLEKSPGIFIDQSGSISLKGKQGVVIFIDDKPTYLSGTDLQNYLRSLPSATLDQIEIMTNPPAKYDAAGGAGVINIKTKKIKVKGLNANFTASYNQGRYGRTNNSINLTYRNKKLVLFSNMNYSKLNTFSDLDIYRRYKNPDESTSSYFLQNTFIRRMGDAYNTKTGIDFYQDDKNTWGIVLTGQVRNSNETNDNVSNLLNANSKLDSVIKAFSTKKGKFKNGGINVNYRHQYNRNGKELTADLDRIVYNTMSDQLFDNESYFADGPLKTKDQLSGTLPSNIDIYSFKTDYTHPLKTGYKLSAGLKSSYTRTDNLANYFSTIDGVSNPDYDKSNHFIYKENINAGYVNLNADYKRLSAQAGLRLENTMSDGNQLGNAMKPDSSFIRNYTSLFPTFYLSYKLDSAANNQFALNYGRRVNRPYYQDLNPFISPLDKFTYYVGNPFLQPAFTHNVELSYTYKNKITSTLAYSKTRNDVNETIEIFNGVYFSRPGNIGSSVVKSISVDANLAPRKWLSFHLYTEVTSIHSKGAFYTGVLDTKGVFWFVQPNAQITFSKGWSAEVSGLYRTAITHAQFIIGALGRVNTGIQKKVSGNMTAKLSVNDIFYTSINKGIINNLALTDATYNNRSDTRQFIITLSYRFGKAITNQRKHEATGAESEQNRVKN